MIINMDWVIKTEESAHQENQELLDFQEVSILQTKVVKQNLSFQNLKKTKKIWILLVNNQMKRRYTFRIK